jgi:hypothetical protein
MPQDAFLRTAVGLMVVLPTTVAQSSFERTFPLDTTGCFATKADGGLGYCGPESCASVNQDDVQRCVMEATTPLDFQDELGKLGCDATCTQVRPIAQNPDWSSGLDGVSSWDPAHPGTV